MSFVKLNEPNVSAEIFDNEVLMVNIITGRYYSIEGSSAIFMRFLLDGNSIETSIDKIVDLYSVDKNEVEKDFSRLVNELEIENLIIKDSRIPVAGQSEWLASADFSSYSVPKLEIHSDMEDLVLLS
jgi:hypothetical protein